MITPQFDGFTPTALGASEPLPYPIIDDLFFSGFGYKTDFIVTVSQSQPNFLGFSQVSKAIGATPPVTNITAKYPTRR